MDMWKEQLTRWGADVREGIHRVADDEEFYRQMLKKAAVPDAWKKLEDAVHRKDSRSAFLAAHELKGVFANLSLDPLYHAADAVVEDLRNDVKDTFPVHFRNLQKKYHEFTDIIESWNREGEK